MPYKDIEKARLACRKSYQKHKEETLARQREKYRENPGAFKYKNERRRKLTLGQPKLPQGTLAKKIAESNNCSYCGVEVNLSYGHGWDHILPFSRGGRHEPSNIVRCCETCNKSKGSKTVAEWVAMKNV